MKALTSRILRYFVKYIVFLYNGCWSDPLLGTYQYLLFKTKCFSAILFPKLESPSFLTPVPCNRSKVGHFHHNCVGPSNQSRQKLSAFNPTLKRALNFLASTVLTPFLQQQDPYKKITMVLPYSHLKDILIMRRVCSEILFRMSFAKSSRNDFHYYAPITTRKKW